MSNLQPGTMMDLADKINAALDFGGYSTSEARASYWSKEISGVQVERIYLNGKKANGYVEQRAGNWSIEKCNFMMLHKIVSAAVKEFETSCLEAM